VVKETNALNEAGYDVTIMTTFALNTLLEEDRTLINLKEIKYIGVINLIPGQASKWSILKNRIVKRLAEELTARFNIQSKSALGYGFSHSLRAAKAEKADLYICHEEVSTVLGCKLIDAGFKVAFDIEDWYSHAFSGESGKRRPDKLMAKYEKYALKKGLLCYTTSESLAGGLAEFAGTKQPRVINNVFPLAERNFTGPQVKDKANLQAITIHWYSQTIGPDRGLEIVAAALELVPIPVELHLRGSLSGNYKAEFESVFPFNKGHKLFFHELVPHMELITRIKEHDIGLASELHVPINRKLTITNKIMQYLLAGIAVIASDTEGQKEVAKRAPAAVFLYEHNSPEQLARQITLLASDPEKLRLAKENAARISEEYFCWDVQKYWLLNWIKTII
jgi:glycosyltransferase involved in cell wall biosynthesis